jgi:hypothetical protein
MSREQKTGSAATVGLFVRFDRPQTLASCEAVGETVRLVGPLAAIRISVGRLTETMCYIYDDEEGWGVGDFFGKPWEEVFKEGSAYFPRGRMTIKVELKFLSDEHGTGTWPDWADS